MSIVKVFMREINNCWIRQYEKLFFRIGHTNSYCGRKMGLLLLSQSKLCEEADGSSLFQLMERLLSPDDCFVSLKNKTINTAKH